MNSERDDNQLLREFVEGGSDAAFTELVQRHVDLVYSVALRQLGGGSSLARDAAQTVFCELARNARKLTTHRTITGWLYTTARFVASRMNRSEMRRAAREIAYTMKTAGESDNEAGWNDVEQILDDAMQDLSAHDREAVLLRYFRNESFTSIGSALGATENAARMRVERALEKLRAALIRRGVTCPASVLSAFLATHAIGTAPAGLAAAIATPAIASAAAASLLPKGLTFLEFMTATKIKTAAVVIAVAGTTTGWIVAQRKAEHLEQGIAEMRQRPAVTTAETSVPAGSQLVTEEELQRLRAQHSELMRLRGEVTQLRRQLREQPVAAPATSEPVAAVPEDAQESERKERLKSVGIARMTIARDWGLAFLKFAQANEGLMPTRFEHAQQNFSKTTRPEILEAIGYSPGGADGDGFEITFHGRLEEVANPSQAIILRDKEPFDHTPDGAAYRTYLFADGHAEIYKAANGDFTAWEEQRKPIVKENPAELLGAE